MPTYAPEQAPDEIVLPFLREYQSFHLPMNGEGYLAGDYPAGISRIDGVPGSATIRVLYRTEQGNPGDGVIVAEVQSGVDGTWRVDGLNPSLRFDVICRKDDYKDMILSNVSPATD